MKYFFSVDWGTSSLRIRLIEIGDDLTIIKETTNQYGCAYVFDSFNDEKEAICREDYFLDFLRPYLIIPNSILPTSPITVVISGMATSSIGLREMPYACLPFNLDGSNSIYELIQRSEQFEYDVLLLSGISSSSDVMRGEEVQLLGLFQHHNQQTEALFILPGTHSKHIYVKDNNILSFKTFITGEMFNLLSTHSLLKNSIEKSFTIDKNAFQEGIRLSEGNLLNNVFSIRASSLLQKTDSTSNFSLLSGLLIGTELRSIKNLDLPIFLCAHKNLAESYSLALQELSMLERCEVIPYKEVDEAVILGQKSMIEKIL